MTTVMYATLEQAELFALAVNASKNGDSRTAVVLLKEAVSRADATAAAHFLLGAEYAQNGLYDRAVAEMESALVLEPKLFAARFQLGLLWLTSGNAQMATDVLQPLEALGSENAFACFATGLRHLVRDEFPDALRCLTQGIGLNTENQALNTDMWKIVEKIQEHSLPVPGNKEAEPPSDSAGTSHILLSAYTGNAKN